MSSLRIPAVAAAALALLTVGCDDPDGLAGEPDAEPVCVDEQALIDPNCFDIVGPPGASTVDRAVAFLDDDTAYDLIAVHVPDGPIRSGEQELVSLTTRLMVEQINRAGGLGVEGGRRLAALLCTDGAADARDHGRGVAAAAHAVSCGARALVGADTTGPALALFDEVARPTGTPLISAGAGSTRVDEALADSADQDLMWRLAVPTDRAAEAAAALVDAVDAYRSVHVFYRVGEPDDEAALAALRSRPGTADLVVHGLDVPDYEIAPIITEALMAQPVDAVISLIGDPLGQLHLASGLIEATARVELDADLLFVDAWVHPDIWWLLQAASTDAEAVDEVLCRTLFLIPGAEGPALRAWGAALAVDASESLYDEGATRLGTPLRAAARFADAVGVTALALAAADRADGAPSTAGVLAALAAMRHADAPAANLHDWPAVLAAADDLGRVDLVGASGPIDFAPETRTLNTGRVELWRYVPGPEDPMRRPGRVDDVGPLLSDADPTGLDWDTLQRLEPDPSVSPICVNARPRLLER